MRHHNRIKKFGRERKVRAAFMRSLARSLFAHGAIETTLARAKALRPFAEKLVTAAKENSVAARRRAARRIGTPEAATILFQKVGKVYADRQGGYTRIIKTGFRRSDGAQRAVIELV